MTSRREQPRPLLPNPEIVGLRRPTRFSSPEVPSLLGRPPVLTRMKAPLEVKDELDEEYYDFKRSSSNERRGYHPYEMKRPLIRERPNQPSGRIPSLFDTKVTPPPLLPPQAVQQLRQSLRNFGPNDEFDEQDSYDQPFMGEPANPLDLAQEEAETKQKINHIIMVAQALKEKLDREGELRELGDTNEDCEFASDFDDRPPPLLRAPMKMGSLEAEPCVPTVPNNLPRLMDLKPKIPSILDINIAPPPIAEVIKENVMTAINVYVNNSDRFDVCWNCDEQGHRFNDCELPRYRVFCFRCGRQGFDTHSCPTCNPY